MKKRNAVIKKIISDDGKPEFVTVYEDLTQEELDQIEIDRVNSAKNIAKIRKDFERGRVFDEDADTKEILRKIKGFDNPGQAVSWVNSKIRINSPHFERDVRDFLVELVKCMAFDKHPKGRKE